MYGATTKMNIGKVLKLKIKPLKVIFNLKWKAMSSNGKPKVLWYPLILIVCKIVLMRNTDPEIGYFQKNKTWSYLKRTIPIYMGL